MASRLRLITASEGLAPVIDRGAEIDRQIKALGKEDGEIKAKIIEEGKEQIEKTETSLKIQGKQAVAVLTASESMSVNAAADEFPALKDLVKRGFLQAVVEEKKALVVPPGDVEKAADVLKREGISATVTYSVSVKAADVRKMRESEVASEEEAKARNALESCLTVSTTHRVKYE